MPAGYFITGTDTDVGKTVVAAAFTLGLAANYWKPVQTGSPADREQVQAWTELPDARFAGEQWRFPMPASPNLAARAAGGQIELSDLRPPWREPGETPWVVEGAGGALVPLNDRETMAELMQALGLPVIVVARTRLGTINHTLLTLEALRRRGLDVAGVIFNGPAEADVARTIAKIGNIAWAQVDTVPLNPGGLRGLWQKCESTFAPQKYR